MENIIVIIYFIVLIFLFVSIWKVYEKANKPGWAALIPIYNFVVWMEIIGKSWWWLLLLFIPFVNIYIAITATNLLSKSFGKDVGFTIGLIFLPFIFYPMLAFNNEIKYQGPAGLQTTGR
jgi:hypothetical protein